MSVSEIRVDSLEFALSSDGMVGLWRDSRGNLQHYAIGPLRELLPLIDDLRDELREPMAVASGNVPRLRRFAAD